MLAENDAHLSALDETALRRAFLEAELLPAAKQTEVPAQPPEGAPSFPPVFSTPPLPDSSSSSSPPPRRAVPTTFNPIINDEANILAAISRGDATLSQLAGTHSTTVSNLCVWLQREDIQQKLSDLATCGAMITRIGAINNLPKAVEATKFTIQGYIFDRTQNLIKPGIEADRVEATREANIRKSCNLLLRLARFEPNRPLYRKRERDPSADILAPSAITLRQPRQPRPAPTTQELLASVAEFFNLNTNPSAGTPLVTSTPAPEAAVERAQRRETATAPALNPEVPAPPLPASSSSPLPTRDSPPTSSPNGRAPPT